MLLSTSSGDDSSTLGAPDVRDRLRDFSGTPREQATRLISLLFPPDRAVEVDAQFGDQMAQARSSFPKDVAAAQWKAMEAWESHGAAGRLHEISCPTLVATGSEDVVIPPANALGLASAIDGAWLARFPRCGHAFMADYPRQLGQLITAFLQTVRPA